ncbi:MAG: hypothetical protein ACKO6N_29595 [Myxococcota bacterium]
MPVAQESTEESMRVCEEIPAEHLAGILEGLEDMKAGRLMPIDKVKIKWADEEK